MVKCEVYNRDIKKSKAAIDAGYNLERIRV